MNGNTDLNLTKAKQSSLEEEITEPNDSETNDPTLIESENGLIPEDRTLLIPKAARINPPPAGGGMNPLPPPPEISSEPEVIV